MQKKEGTEAETCVKVVFVIALYSTHLVCYTLYNTVIDISSLKQIKILHKDKK